MENRFLISISIWIIYIAGIAICFSFGAQSPYEWVSLLPVISFEILLIIGLMIFVIIKNVKKEVEI